MFRRFIYNHPHPFEDLHDFVCTAMKLICQAPKNGNFSRSVVAKVDPVFKEWMIKEQANTGDCLYAPLEELFELIKAQPVAQKKLLLAAIDGNNKIDDICNLTTVPLVEYKHIRDKTIAKKLKDFFNNLYDVFLNRPSFIAYATEKARTMGWPPDACVNFLEHFRKLIKENQMRVCPFCGMHPLLTEFDIGRNAYDHFLPKGVIPFVSVNFRNLAPMCDECNSKNKKAKVPVFFKGVPANRRVKAFYPFANKDPQVAIGFKLANKEKTYDKLLPQDLALEINTSQQEEAESWKDIFGIDVRYKARAIVNIVEWLGQLLTAYDRQKKTYDNVTWEKFIQLTLDTYTDSPLTDQYFLKYAMLKCLLDQDNLLDRLKEFSTDTP